MKRSRAQRPLFDDLPRAADDSGPEPVEISIIGEIGWEVSGADVRKDIKAAGKDAPLAVAVHSGGGSIFESFLIFNSLAEHPGPVSVDILGISLSAASWIPLAADPGKIRIRKLAKVMIHNARGGVFGTAEEMRGRADLLASLDQQMAQLYADRSGKPLAEVAEMMDAETWMSPAEALEFGIVDSVVERPAVENRLDLSNLSNVPDDVAELYGLNASRPRPASSFLAQVALATASEPAPSDPSFYQQEALVERVAAACAKGVTL